MEKLFVFIKDKVYIIQRYGFPLLFIYIYDIEKKCWKPE